MTNAVSKYHKLHPEDNPQNRAAHKLALALEYAEAGIPAFPCKDGSTTRKDRNAKLITQNCPGDIVNVGLLERDE